MTPSIPGAPDHELYRSPAAERIAKLAAKSGLLLSHFEHRVDLELPDDWMTEDRPDLGTPQGWQGGVLPETKYGSFQHDRIIGSFHPGHRAKWTTHELCHGLVGFAWYPGCSRFFQALSARMSEILPVALYYFFDEAGLRRCPVHDGRGALFGHYCADCEAQAQRGPVDDPKPIHGIPKDAPSSNESWTPSVDLYTLAAWFPITITAWNWPAMDWAMPRPMVHA